MFRKAIPEARNGLANLILGIPEEDVDTDMEMGAGAVLYSLMAGLLIQRFADTDRTPTGADHGPGTASARRRPGGQRESGRSRLEGDRGPSVS